MCEIRQVSVPDQGSLEVFSACRKRCLVYFGELLGERQVSGEKTEKKQALCSQQHGTSLKVSLMLWAIKEKHERDHKLHFHGKSRESHEVNRTILRMRNHSHQIKISGFSHKACKIYCIMTCESAVQ